ncbi:MAG: FAA hydrolase family protein [Caldilinea sp. CFX5]|nr:FAA hydrolase family protein [Caldilinea sp. CFX5]
MKHARIRYNGQPQAGVVVGDQIRLADGATVPVASADYLCPIEPRQVLATHLTYRSRCVEYKMTKIPEYPAYFVKPLNSVSHHNAPVARPRGCKFLNYEGEVAVVISKRCKNVSIDQALDYVRGYTICNDFGLHEFRHADRGAMVRVKGQDGFGPMGPFLVDRDDVDPDSLILRTYVNGQVVQEAQVGSDLMFSFAYQVADLSRVITLEPNDVILTGTPANSRPVTVGDVVEVEVSGIGRLRNTIVELDYDLQPVGIPPEVTPNTLHVALAMPEDEAARRVGEFR